MLNIYIGYQLSEAAFRFTPRTFSVCDRACGGDSDDGHGVAHDSIPTTGKAVELEGFPH